MDIQEFLLKNPSVPEILEFIDSEAKRLVSKRKLQSKNLLNSLSGGE